MSELNRRLDDADAASSEPAQEPFPELGSTSVSCSRIGRFTHWTERAAHWAREQAGRFMGFSEISDEEEIVHEMGRLLEGADDPELIEKALIESVTRMTGARSVRWIREPDLSPGAGDGRLRLELCAGLKSRGRLLVLPPSDHSQAWSPATHRRLRTLCTMAASALNGQDQQDPRRPQPSCGVLEAIAISEAVVSAPSAALEDFDFEKAEARGNHPVAAALQDATFLNAVLPFALGQARRHGEPLSLLCVVIDRLSGIHELLGKDRAERAVRNVGTHIATMIRDSDIVARLDDDRIVVVLPRARIHDAWRVAERICRTVEKSPTLLPELPVLTVSIGVAEYPACAETVYALLDAADHALTMARNQGRNRAVAAPFLAAAQALPAPAQCAS